jgi:hypothetical protein
VWQSLGDQKIAELTGMGLRGGSHVRDQTDAECMKV